MNLQKFTRVYKLEPNNMKFPVKERRGTANVDEKDTRVFKNIRIDIWKVVSL